LAVCAQALPWIGVANTKPATTTTSFAIVSWTRQEFGRKASHSDVPQGTIVERPQRHHRRLSRSRRSLNQNSATGDVIDAFQPGQMLRLTSDRVKS
jgi:hypothetical protein